ncbi:MAG: hypothetical protein U0166_16785 [Acidobacteriota bacterium]
MGRKTRKAKAAKAALAEAAGTSDATVTVTASGVAPRSQTAPARAPEKTLMETLDGSTSASQVLGIVALMSLIPTAICLLVKYAIVPALFPGW